MPLLLAEAAKLTQNELQAGIIRSVLTVSEILPFIPLFETDAPAIVYNREATLASGAFIDTVTPITEGAATFTQITTPLTILAGDVDVHKFLQSLYSKQTDQAAAQISAKAKALARQLEQALIIGNGAPPNISGWQALATGGQSVASVGANGDALSFAQLDNLVDAIVIARGSGQLAFVGNAQIKAKFLALLRSINYNGPWFQIPGTLVQVPTYRGVPFLQTDWIPNTETKGTLTTGSSLYCVNFDENEGISMAIGRQMADAENLAGAGLFAIERVGTVQNQDANRYRVKLYGAQLLKSDKAIGRQRELITL